MLSRRKICFAILFLVLGSACAVDCPRNEICKCKPNRLTSFKISCKVKNSSIDILIKEGESIKVNCYNTNWSDFQLYNLTKRFINSVSFYMCDLPKNNSLKTLTDMLGATNVERLIFHSYKNSTSFKSLHLKNFKNLRSLDLSNNLMSSVDVDLLTDLPNLRKLYLRNNNLNTTILLFNQVPKLQQLDLEENTLEWIESNTLNFHNLTFLSLKENKLTQLGSRIFDKLVNLESINLLSNDLISLPEDIFGKLKSLQILNLAENRFVLLPKYLLQNNTNLQIFNLSFNKKKLHTLPNGFFNNLTNLEKLELQNNGFISLPEDLLWGCLSLNNVVLSKNNLDDLPALIFRDSKELLKLQLDSNAFKEVPNIFQNLKHLSKLDLSKNRILAIDKGVFDALLFLEELNMAENSLALIVDLSLHSLSSLEIANFSHNNLTLYPSSPDEFDFIESPFAACHTLKKLYLSYNRISEIFVDWIIDLENLEELDLKHNYISTISAEDLLFTSEYIEMDLTYNKIQHIFLNNAEILFKHDWSNNVVVSIEHNPLHCDCELHDYLSYIKGKMHPNIKRYIDIDPKNLTCFTPIKLRDVRIMDLQLESFTTENCTTKSYCPDECNCFSKLISETFVIDCSGKNFTVVPSVKNTPHKFWQVKLDLSHNQLTEIPNLINLGYESVTELVLAYNNISEISLNGLPKTLQIMELNNNNISKLSPDVMNFLKTLKTLFLLLRGNPLVCDCSTIDFFNFIHLFFPYLIHDRDLLTCQETNKFLFNMTVTEFCPNNTNNKTESYNMKIFLITFFSVGFLISVGIIFYYIWRRQLRKKHFAQHILLEDLEENEENEVFVKDEKCYDVFISHSKDDVDFVMTELVNILEENSSTPLKLYLPYRDWSADEWTVENITKSMELSKKMVVVMSPSFLKDIWGKTELRLAHCDIDLSNVILILHDDIELTDEYLDLELETFINANTHIQLRDPCFRKKLEQLLMPNSDGKTKGSKSAFSGIVRYCQTRF